MGKNLKGKECGTVTGIGEQDHLRHRKVNAPFRVLTKHAESAHCPFVLSVGTKKLVKRRKLGEYISRTMAI